MKNSPRDHHAAIKALGPPLVVMNEVRCNPPASPSLLLPRLFQNNLDEERTS